MPQPTALRRGLRYVAPSELTYAGNFGYRTLVVLFGSLAGLAQTVQLLATAVGSAGLLAIDQAFKRISDDETVARVSPVPHPTKSLSIRERSGWP